MTRSRLVFDRLDRFLPSGIDHALTLGKTATQPIKSLRDLTRQLTPSSA